jgi:hypothetical protein
MKIKKSWYSPFSGAIRYQIHSHLQQVHKEKE